MGTSSLQADSLLQPQRKRSFSLPSFRRSSGGDQQEVARSAEEAVRIQKAAAWQWYTRGVDDAVVPTKRPPVGHSPPSQPPTGDKSGVDKGGNSNKVLQKKLLESAQAESPRAASRFKTEAAALTQPTGSGRAPPTPSAPSDGPSTPLYDELELSGLRTQMADFVQRLQNKDLIIADHQKSKASPNFPAVSITKAPPSVAAATASNHQLTKPPSSAAPVASTVPFHIRPFSALRRLFCKVVSGSILKSTKKSHNFSPAVYEPEVPLAAEEDDDNTHQYHYHHYIHHHHHYHYGESPEESATTITSRRRNSESSGIRPRIPSLLEAESDMEVEESPIDAYLARRRRHSDSSAGRIPPKKVAFGEAEGMREESPKAALQLQFPRRYESERFSPNKIPIMVSTDFAQPAAAGGGDEFDEELADMKSRRQNYWEESLERKAEGGGKSGGGTYKLGGAAGGATPAKPLVRRRHSESSQRSADAGQIGKRTPSPDWPYWEPPSARYYVDVLERHIGVPAAAKATPARSLRNAGLPPLYPQ